MREADAAKVILVRAIEESDQTAQVFDEETLKRAYEEAGDRFGDVNWFLTRASYLVDRLPPAYRSILQIPGLPDKWILIFSALAFVIGLASNYLGPTQQIHVIFNPILVLISWNLLLYFVLLAKWLAARASQSPAPAKVMPEHLRSTHSPPNRAARLPWGVRFFIPSVWRIVHSLMSVAWSAGAHVSEFRRIFEAFWINWCAVASSLVVARWRRMLHVSAISLAFGAIIGIYIRGLFLEYRVVWSSTFITNQETIETIIGVIFGPAILIYYLFEGMPEQTLEFSALTTAAGSPAAGWIHLYAMTTVLLILCPRTALIIWESRRLARARNDINIDLDSYYVDKVAPQLKNVIQREINIAAAKFSEGTATYVAEALYEERIAPELDRFRTNGGKLSDLKRRITDLCQEFQPKIRDYMKEATREFEHSLAVNIERVVRDIQPDVRVSRVSEQSWSSLMGGESVDSMHGGFNRVGHTFADAINVAVSVSIASVVGVLSGGLGDSLGVALIVELTAVSGPVGFVIGALGALIVTGAAMWMGREKISGTIENVSIPGFVLRSVLWSSRYKKLKEDGKKRTRASVKNEVDKIMNPMVTKLGDELSRRVSRLLANA